MFDDKKILIGALGGLLSAIIVDLDAYASSEGAFNWRKAFARWGKGIIVGVLTGSGMGALVA